MGRTHTINLDAPPVRVGQLREDKYGGRIRVARIAGRDRWVCTYPRLEHRIIELSTVTIEQLYPTLIAS